MGALPCPTDISSLIVGTEMDKWKIVNEGDKVDNKEDSAFSKATPSEEKSLEGNFETGAEGPFARRESLRRTPPRLRAFSLPDLEDELRVVYPSTQIEQPYKRKRMENTPEARTSVSEGVRLKNLLGKIINHVKKLDKVVAEMYKPKQEVKEAVIRLTYEIETLQSKELMEWLEEAASSTHDDQVQLLQSENQELQEWIKCLEAANKKDVEYNTLHPTSDPCESCKNAAAKLVKRRALKQDESYENFLKVTEEEWGDEIFTRSKIEPRNIWDTPAGYEIILPCNESFQTNNRIVGKAINKFGGLDGLKRQNKSKGEAASMMHSLGFPDCDGKMTYTTRDIYYPIITRVEKVEEADDKDVFKSLKAVKSIVLKQQKKNKLAVPEMEGIGGIVFMRIMEYLFADTGVQITMYKPGVVSRNPPQAIQVINPNARVRINPTTNKTQRKPRHEALLVQMKGKSYADLLKTVKQAVNPTEIGVVVKDVIKTRNGELILTIENGSDKAEVLRRELTEKLPEVTTSMLRNKTVIHIKDLDEVATEDEVREAVSKSISVRPEAIEIRALRPAYGSKQNVTLVMAETDGQKLIGMGKIKIGWTSCRILERKKEVKCFKCWEHGHVKAQCNGPDRERMCLKCGKEGHQASDCQNTPYCVHCKQEGHQSGNSKCTAFRNRGKPNEQGNSRK